MVRALPEQAGWLWPNLQLTTEGVLKPHSAVPSPVPAAECEAADTPSSRAGDQPDTRTGPLLLLCYWVLVLSGLEVLSCFGPEVLVLSWSAPKYWSSLAGPNVLHWA